MTIIPTKAIFGAAHCLYAAAFADAFEQAGGSWGSGTEITQHVEPLTEAQHAPIIHNLIGRLHQAWGVDPGLVFHHMYEWLKAQEPKEQFMENCLYRTLMGCFGHGVFLTDDLDMHYAWDHTVKLLNIKVDAVPFHVEDTDYREIADDLVAQGKGFTKASVRNFREPGAVQTKAFFEHLLAEGEINTVKEAWEAYNRMDEGEALSVLTNATGDDPDDVVGYMSVFYKYFERFMLESPDTTLEDAVSDMEGV